jgi:putative ABC transport system permease protein
MLWESFKLALRTIRRNVLRSILTLLGIVIGVAAVIALVTIGRGATDKVTADLTKLGSNMLIARPGTSTPGPSNPGESRSFSARDIDSLQLGLTNIRAMAPVATRTVQAVFEQSNTEAQVTGTTPGFFIAQDWTFAAGGPFTENDARSGTTVCVIGETIRKELFGFIEPLGQILRVRNAPCEVVGVLGAKGQSAFGSDQDNIVVMPLRTFHRRISGNTRIGQIIVSASSPDDLVPVQAAMTDILRETRRVKIDEEDDFVVRDLTQIANTLSGTTAVMTGLLSAIAAVSLLVGGIGIMNIMLVSVAERTREIGIRLAIGARAAQVLSQFLVEAIVLCLLGGLIGIALGLSLAFVAANLLQLPFAIDWDTVALAFTFSGLIGVLFGFFPARRAAKLDPIEALRHE